VCDPCQKAKSHQLPYPISTSVSTVPLEQIFSDVWDPAPASVNKHPYYVSFINDFSKFTWIYLIKKRSDVYQVFLNFQKLVERKFGRKIITIQTDWGGEYEKLHSFFQRNGITHHVSCPHAHQQNGSAERKHRHIVEVGLALLANASMPLKFWDEAFLTATFLINLLPTKVLNFSTPTEKLINVIPNYDSLRIFGCACWPNLRPYNKHKLAFRSKQCVFLGYSPLHKGVKCLDVSTGRVYISCDVVFDEKVFPFASLDPNAGTRHRTEILLLRQDTPSTPSSSLGEANHDHMYFVPLTDPMQAGTSAASSTTLNSHDTAEEIAQNGATTEPHEANQETPDKTATNTTSADPEGDLAESASAPDREPASDHATSCCVVNDQPVGNPKRKV
jgi:histone deacetylase 1/2